MYPPSIHHNRPQISFLPDQIERELTCDAVDIQDLPSQVEARDHFRLEGVHIHLIHTSNGRAKLIISACLHPHLSYLFQRNSSTGHELVLVLPPSYTNMNEQSHTYNFPLKKHTLPLYLTRHIYRRQPSWLWIAGSVGPPDLSSLPLIRCICSA